MHLIDSEDEIICDLAQTYHVLNYQELPPSLVATLVVGLPEDSRLKKKITGTRVTLDNLLMAVMIDNFNNYVWSKRRKRGSRPKSLYKKFAELDKPKDDLMSFRSPEEYERWMARKKEKWQCQKSQKPTCK